MYSGVDKPSGWKERGGERSGVDISDLPSGKGNGGRDADAAISLFRRIQHATATIEKTTTTAARAGIEKVIAKAKVVITPIKAKPAIVARAAFLTSVLFRLPGIAEASERN